jgi:hypothetical protein
MSTAADPTWYESLLQKQQDANLKLVSLCAKQQKLIKHLEKALEDKGIEKPLTAPESSSSSSLSSGADDGHVTLGPKSPRLNWTGTTTDLIPISASGNHYRALIITSGMIKTWNKVLGISRKMRKYIKERDIAVDAANWASNLLSNRDAWEDTPQGEMIAGRLVSDLVASHTFHCERVETLEDNLLVCDTDIAHGREHLEHKIRLIFKRHDILSSPDDGWLQDLRGGRDKKAKEMAKGRESTSIETPDCDSVGDDF